MTNFSLRQLARRELNPCLTLIRGLLSTVELRAVKSVIRASPLIRHWVFRHSSIFPIGPEGFEPSSFGLKDRCVAVDTTTLKSGRVSAFQTLSNVHPILQTAKSPI